MSSRTEVISNLDGLEEIKKKVGSSMRARVGVLGSQAHQKEALQAKGYKSTRTRQQKESGITNAELMLIMMMGSLSRNIPARDPLYLPLIRHRRELLQKLNTPAMRAAFEKQDYKKMFTLLGIAAEEIVQNAFETSGDGNWPPLAQATIDAKGSSKPLINTSQLRRSVSSDVVNQAGPAKGGIHTVSI